MKKCNLIIVFVFAVAAHAQTNKTVLPPGFENVNGNSQDATFSGSVPVYQELFRGSLLANSWKTPVQITGVAFRVADGVSSSLDVVIPRVEIRLSTSTRTPEQMVQAYSSNKGADETVTFIHTDVPLFGSAGQTVNPFDVKFKFDTPFLYDSKNGSLLMYIANTGPNGASGARSLDAQIYANLDETSPFASFGGGGFLAPSAYGLVTEFEWQVIPEPSVPSLLTMAIVSIWIFFRKPNISK